MSNKITVDTSKVAGVLDGKGGDLLYWAHAIKTAVEAVSLQDCSKVYQGEIV